MTEQPTSAQASTQPLRLFIAVGLPVEIRAALTDLQDKLKGLDGQRAIRWVNVESVHLTLKFLGDTPVSQRGAVEAGLREAAAGHGALPLHVEGTGCFPNTRRPRVVWAGVGGDLTALRSLQESVEQAITPLGFPRENRAFSPHLTLGRARQEASPAALAAFGAQVEQLAGTLVRSPEWHVTALSLMRSELKPSGAAYSQLAAAELGRPR